MCKGYGYTPNQVAEMTPFQQLMLLTDDKTDPYSKTVHFDTYQEYLDWRNEN